MLLCHPHPGDFQDKSRPFHCCYFMGLQRKQGGPANEGGQFDIRLTVEEFKQSVNIYMLWKPGMEIYVTHVKRRNIPAFVFPGGVRPSRPVKIVSESRRGSGSKVSGHAGSDRSCEGKLVSDGADDGRKRKRVDDNIETQDSKAKGIPVVPVHSGEVREGSPPVSTVSSCSVKSDQVEGNVSGESRMENPENNAIGTLSIRNTEVSSRNGEGDGSVRCNPPSAAFIDSVVTSSSKEAEKLAIEKMMCGPYVAHQASPQELDELEDDFDFGDRVKDVESTKGSPMESSTANVTVAAPVTSSNKAGPSTGSYSNGVLEELEVFSTIPWTCYFFIAVAFLTIICLKILRKNDGCYLSGLWCKKRFSFTVIK